MPESLGGPEDRHPVDELIRALRAPEPPREPPHVQYASAWSLQRILFGGGAVALAAVGALVFVLSKPPEGALTPRGAAVAPAPAAVELRLATAMDGVASPLAPGGALIEGQALYFRVSATRDVRVWVWVDGPSGREEVGVMDAGPAAKDLIAAGGNVAWSGEQPGSYTFHASSESGTCNPGTCASVTVVVGR